MDNNKIEMQNTASEVKWNDEVRLIVSDVDETIADNYTPAEPEMIKKLTTLLGEGKVLFLVTGASLARMRSRIIDAIPQNLRKQIVAAHCSGAEVWGFTPNGQLREHPFYSLSKTALTEEQKKLWREKVQQLLKEFQLKVFDPAPALEFKQKAGDDPLSIMVEDRGPQITFEVVNGYDLSADQVHSLETPVPETHGGYDLRIPIFERAEQVFAEAHLPITPRLGGMWAIDFAIKGVNKTTAVKHVLNDKSVLQSLGLTPEDVRDPKKMEIWGDRFSALRGGTDRHMCEALPKQVRAIDFREENPAEFPEGYNVVLWSRKHHLHNGLLEYLQSRHE